MKNKNRTEYTKSPKQMIREASVARNCNKDYPPPKKIQCQFDKFLFFFKFFISRDFIFPLGEQHSKQLPSFQTLQSLFHYNPHNYSYLQSRY